MGINIKRKMIMILILIFSIMPLWPAEIHEAVKKGDLNRVQEILARSPEGLDQQDEFGRTPLLTAVFTKQEAVFKFLLERGADANRPDREGTAPLHIASFLGLDEWAGRLLGQNAQIDAQDIVRGYAPLHLASRAGRLKCVELLLAKGARPDLRDAAGNTPLLLAASNGHVETVSLLLAKEASPRDRDRMGSAALHLAALSGNEQIVKMLLEKGAALNEKNRYRSTPLSIAEREGHDAIVRVLLAAGAKKGKAKPPELKGEYLGQKRPGLTPSLFASGVVSTEKNELNSVFTPDGKEFYFTVRTPQGPWKIMVMKRRGRGWSRPQAASFSGTHSDVDLFIAPDGKKLYFCSNRPGDGKTEAPKNYDIWVVDRLGADWSEPRNLGRPVNSNQDEFFPALTRDGTIYFQSRRQESGEGAKIYRAQLEEGAYRQAEILGPAINCETFVGDTLIAPDESWAVFSVNRPGGNGQGDLHVSFRLDNDTWTEPKNLGERVNTKANENCPILTPNGKYLFYTSAGDIYWVSAEIIEKWRPKQ